MADTDTAADTPSETPAEAAAAASNVVEARAHFTKALEEARTGASLLGQEARERTETYTSQLTGQIAVKRTDLTEDAKALTETAKDRAAALANDGKAKASGALTGLGKIVADNAGTLDDKLGAKYGDYARTAAQQIQDAATKLDSKDLSELGEDAKSFVRAKPGTAIGLAAVAGFLLARLFRGSSND